MSLATASRVDGLQALSPLSSLLSRLRPVSLVCHYLLPSLSPFLVPSLAHSWCSPYRILLWSWRSLSSFVQFGLFASSLIGPPRFLTPSHLFVSPGHPYRALSLAAVSFFLREVLCEAGAPRPVVGVLRSPVLWGVFPSLVFLRNWSVSGVLEATTWSSGAVFLSFYLHDILFFALLTPSSASLLTVRRGGFVYGDADVLCDWVPWVPSSHFRNSVIIWPVGLDSLFLQLPAIDMVWPLSPSL